MLQSRLKELLHYDPETGIFTWLKDRYCGRDHTRKSVCAGAAAGCRTKFGKTHYIEIRIDGHKFLAHRLAFVFMGEPIPGIVDHKDTDGVNNRWSNLRPSSKSTNAMNRSAPANNSSGVKGVSETSDGTWHAYVTRDGVRENIGWFKSLAEAARARQDRASQVHGEFGRHS